MRIPKKSLVIDISNILFRVAAVKKNDPYSRGVSDEDLVGLCMHMSLFSIHKHYNKFNPDFIVFAFEGGNNWRKTFTKKEKSRKGYKANRIIDPTMKHYYELLDSFRTVISAHTSICCLCIDTMEADDAIAAYCQLYASDEHEIIIISGDRDFTQLLKLPQVKLVNPDNGKLRNTEQDKEYEPDLDYWLFKKCVRGDGGDNVPSAFPKVRETKIKKAYEDQYERLNFMNTTWKQIVLDTDENGNDIQIEVEHRVGDLFEENVILMDLMKQPGDSRLILEEGVRIQVENIGNYSHFHFLRFLGKFNLKKVSEEASRFIDMFSNNQRFRKGSIETIKKNNVNIQEESIEKEKPNNLLSF